ncbi:hypothetical protein BKA70DRAFT_1274732 [Coprinopsis sp. MPI-PUGE-AT-0042]|nr:hypothetical protein BKA70DRAFT_1274732 [Coprinopsis sp. MPI-PUGE-AT-0042]
MATTQGSASDSSSTLDNPKTSTAAAFRMSLSHSMGEWRVYLSAAIFVVAFTLILGIICLSFLKPKVEPLLFGLDIASILLSLGTFAALCFFVQRSKDQKYGDNPWDPNYIDILCALGIVTLFGLSSLAQLKELPARCWSGPNADFKAIGPEVCGVLATMGAFSIIGGFIMLVSTILIAVSIREAKEIAKLPPPVFPTGAEASVMRWLDRNDPFAVAGRQNNPNDSSLEAGTAPRTPTRSNSLPQAASNSTRVPGRASTLSIQTPDSVNNTTTSHNRNSSTGSNGRPPSSRSNSLGSPGMTEVSFQGASIRTPGVGASGLRTPGGGAGAGGLRTPGFGGFNGGPMISAGVNPWGRR